MDIELADKIANAVLYEGYILYPYRPSVKNRQRWTFGGLYPRSYSEAQTGPDAWTMQSQCLVRGDRSTRLTARARFLHLQDRTVGELTPPLAELPGDTEPDYRPVESLLVGERRYQSWQEAVEREIAPDSATLGDLMSRPKQEAFTLPHHREVEPLCGPGGEAVGLLVRERQPVNGSVEISAEPVAEAEGLFRITARIFNRTPWEGGDRPDRDEVLLRSLVSTHLLLSVEGGEFVSLMDPPEPCREAAAACRNRGCWPVLVGENGEKDTMLCSPIILYDYPEIAPESPGDLFDGTEIDEILTLRIMTLTEREKQEMVAVDDRARALLERTEALARDQLMGLHGTMRNPKPKPGGWHGQAESAELARADRAGGGEDPMNSWPPTWTTKNSDGDPRFPEPERTPRPRSVRVAGVELRAGDRVRLRPRRRADAFDIALRDEIATIEDIEQDYEDRIHLAVTIDADPGKDLGRQRKNAHRFFFGIDEVEPLEQEA